MPNDAVSGIYIGHLVREDGTAGESHMAFVVRDDDGRSDVLFQTSDTTWQAYNEYGGNSLYAGSPAGRAYKVSYNRPFTTRGDAPEDWVFNAEYPMVRWLERNGYNLSYSTGVDSDRRGAELLEHRTLLSVGHDEYWSQTQRANWEAARAAGVNMAFFSGNEVFWKTRWEDNHRTLVTYKETHANAKIDPTAAWTGTWRDPRFSPPADGGRPENALTGQIFTVNAGATTAIQVPAADGRMRFWRNTTIATPGGRRHRDAAERHARLRVGRGPRQRPPPGGRVPALVDDGDGRAGAAGLRLDLRERHRAAQHDALPRARAARACSAPAPCSGRGGWTPTTTAAARRPTRACSRPRSTCWRTWAASRTRCRPA